MRAKARYWWASFAVSYEGGDVFRDMVFDGEHPFQLARDNWDGRPFALINFREITYAEYILHPEHVP